MEAAWARVVVPPGSSLPSLPLMSPLPLAQLMAVVAHELTALLSGNWVRSPWGCQVDRPLNFGVVIQHLGELLPAVPGRRGELSVSLAGHHAVLWAQPMAFHPSGQRARRLKSENPAEAGLPL